MDNSEDNKEKEENKPAGEMNDEAQSQTSEKPSEFSGIANASMEGTTEQEPLARAYDAAVPSFTLEGEDDKAEEDTDEEDFDLDDDIIISPS
ncbi:hypothetical protein [Pedobacter immunditicola]|uniref:hypothetical protein n=1 Tax=Pedobacter immunditicola TaxID=3133440 RepID=UPI0030AEAB03